MILFGGEFETVFEVTDKQVDWRPVLVLGTVFLLSVLGVFARERAPFVPPRWLCQATMVTSALLLLGACSKLYVPQFWAIHELRTGDYSVVEGAVQGLPTMPPQGHPHDCISVAEKKFCYSDFIGTPGFNRTVSNGGPLRNGVYARISFHDQTILKVEILNLSPVTCLTSSFPNHSATHARRARATGPRTPDPTSPQSN
jgi:hypothetical protein